MKRRDYDRIYYTINGSIDNLHPIVGEQMTCKCGEKTVNACGVCYHCHDVIARVDEERMNKNCCFYMAADPDEFEMIYELYENELHEDVVVEDEPMDEGNEEKECDDTLKCSHEEDMIIE